MSSLVRRALRPLLGLALLWAGHPAAAQQGGAEGGVKRDTVSIQDLKFKRLNVDQPLGQMVLTIAAPPTKNGNAPKCSAIYSGAPPNIKQNNPKCQPCSTVYIEGSGTLWKSDPSCSACPRPGAASYWQGGATCTTKKNLVANFTPATGYVDTITKTITFNPCATAQPAYSYPLTSWAWDFGDGTLLNSGPSCTSVTHAYSSLGAKSVKLTVANGGLDNSGTATHTITIVQFAPCAYLQSPPGQLTNNPGCAPCQRPGLGTYNQGGAMCTAAYPLNASLSVSPSSGSETSTFALNGCGSSPSTNAYPIESYTFSFSDGSSSIVLAAPTCSTTKTWPNGSAGVASATQTTTLTVANSKGDTPGSASRPTTVTHSPRQITVAIAASPNPANEGTVVNFSCTDGPATAMPRTSYVWDFGDGSGTVTTATCSTTHTYANDNFGAQRTASVTASNGGNDTPGSGSMGITTLHVKKNLVASLSGTPAAVVNGSAVTVNACSSSTAGSNYAITSYAFNFGDGTSTTTASCSVSHTYSGPLAFEGAKTISLTVSNSMDNAGTTSQGITVTHAASSLTAVLTAPSPTMEGSTITLNGCSSSPAAMAYAISTYAWTFGDGTSATTTAPTCSISHTYPAGVTSRTASLTVSNGADAPGTASQAISFTHAPRNLGATITASPTTGTVTFNTTLNACGSDAASQAGAYTITNYAFYVNGGLYTNTGACSITYAMSAVATYSFYVVTSDGGADNPTLSPTVTVKGTGTLSAALSAPSPVAEFSTITLNGCSSAPNGAANAITTYSWTFGDGATATTGAGTCSVSHTYPAGVVSRTASLTVSNGSGDAPGTASQVISFTHAPRALGATLAASPAAGIVPFGTTLSACGSDAASAAGANPITSYAFYLNGSLYTTTASCSIGYTMSAVSTYSFYVVTSNGSDTPRTSPTVTVSGNGTLAARLSAPASAVEGSTITLDGCSSSPNGAANPIATYSWAFGDGATAATSAPTCSIAHTYPAGVTSRTASLTVSNGTGDQPGTASQAISFTHAPRPLGATLALSQTNGTVPYGITVNACGSDAASGGGAKPITSYAYYLNGGLYTTTSSCSIGYTMSAVSTYSFYVVTSNGADSPGTSATVTFRGTGTLLAALSAPSPVTEFSTITLNGCSSSPNGANPITTYSWDFGDGNTTTTGAGTCSVSHTYPGGVGTRTAALTVSNGSGDAPGSASQAISFTHAPRQLGALLSANPTSGVVPYNVTLNACTSDGASAAGANGITTYAFSLNGSPYTSTASCSISYTMSAAGTYSFRVTTSNGSDTPGASNTVSVSGNPPMPCTLAGGSGNAGDATCQPCSFSPPGPGTASSDPSCQRTVSMSETYFDYADSWPGQYGANYDTHNTISCSISGMIVTCNVYAVWSAPTAGGPFPGRAPVSSMPGNAYGTGCTATSYDDPASGGQNAGCTVTYDLSSLPSGATISMDFTYYSYGSSDPSLAMTHTLYFTAP